MVHCRRLIGFILFVAEAALGLGCSRSPAPAVAVPVVADEPSDPPKVELAAESKDNNGSLADGGTFPFPDDSGGRALAKTLTPASPPPMPGAAVVAPRERKLPASFARQALPPPDLFTIPPRLVVTAPKELRPVTLPDRIPPDLGGFHPQLPPRAELPTGPLVRQESRDVSKPMDLPFLSSRPAADRAPLSDPTVEFTARSVVSSSLPLRTLPVGFLRIPLPDPFEHADAARPRTPVVEDPNRALGSPPPPRN